MLIRDDWLLLSITLACRGRFTFNTIWRLRRLLSLSTFAPIVLDNLHNFFVCIPVWHAPCFLMYTYKITWPACLANSSTQNPNRWKYKLEILTADVFHILWILNKKWFFKYWPLMGYLRNERLLTQNNK